MRCRMRICCTDCPIVAVCRPGHKLPIRNMATLSKTDVVAALTRLGEIAQAQSESVELILLGGSLMVLEFQTVDARRGCRVSSACGNRSRAWLGQTGCRGACVA